MDTREYQELYWSNYRHCQRPCATRQEGLGEHIHSLRERYGRSHWRHNTQSYSGLCCSCGGHRERNIRERAEHRIGDRQSRKHGAVRGRRFDLTQRRDEGRCKVVSMIQYKRLWMIGTAGNSGRWNEPMRYSEIPQTPFRCSCTSLAQSNVP